MRPAGVPWASVLTEPPDALDRDGDRGDGVVEPHDGRIILAGDAFGGPKIEGAFLSGTAAADQINRRD